MADFLPTWAVSAGFLARLVTGAYRMATSEERIVLRPASVKAEDERPHQQIPAIYHDKQEDLER